MLILQRVNERDVQGLEGDRVREKVREEQENKDAQESVCAEELDSEEKESDYDCEQSETENNVKIDEIVKELEIDNE